MKKLLGISLVAVLAASPFAARAEGPVAGDATHAESAVVSSAEPGYALVESAQTDSNAASAGYVKGAYNSAIKAINKVNSNINATIGSEALTTTAQTLKGAINEVKSGGNDAIAALDATVSQTAGADGLAISVTQTDGVITAVSGSIAANTYDAYESAANAKSAVETKLTAGANGYDIDAKTLQVQDVDVVTVSGQQTLTNKTIDVDSNSVSNIEVDNFKSGAIVDSTTGIAAASSASDSALVTEKAVAAKIEGTVTGLGMSDYAKKTGVVKTIQDTTIDTTVGQFALTSGTVSGTASVAIMDDWSNPNTPASTPLSVTHSLAVATDITEGTVSAAINDNSVSYTEPTPGE